MRHDDSAAPGNPAGPDPRKDSDRHTRRTQLAVAVITVLGAVIVALIDVKPWQHPNSRPANLTISAPTAGVHVNGARGIEVIGNACNMTALTGWLFDYDIVDEFYYMDYSTNSTDNAGPIIVNNGDWAYNDAPIGSPGDNNQAYNITAVLASPACTKILEATRPDSSGNIRFKALPSGCRVEASVAVDVTYR